MSCSHCQELCQMAPDWLHKSEQPIGSQVSKLTQLMTWLQLINFRPWGWGPWAGPHRPAPAPARPSPSSACATGAHWNHIIKSCMATEREFSPKVIFLSKIVFLPRGSLVHHKKLYCYQGGVQSIWSKVVFLALRGSLVHDPKLYSDPKLHFYKKLYPYQKL